METRPDGTRKFERFDSDILQEILDQYTKTNDSSIIEEYFAQKEIFEKEEKNAKKEKLSSILLKKTKGNEKKV